MKVMIAVTIIEHSELRRLLQDLEMVRYAKILAGVEPGFYSSPELGHRVAGPDIAHRKAFYTLVNVLVDGGDLAQLMAWHNKSQLRIIEIEADHLRDLFADLGLSVQA